MRRRQTTAPQGLGVLSLSVSEVLGNSEYLVSPYFPTTDMRKVGTDRDTKPSLTTMKAIVNNYTFHSSPSIGTSVNVGFFSGASFVANDLVPILDFNYDTDNLPNATRDAIIAWASSHSYGTLAAADIIGVDTTIDVSGLANAPQGAIADCPADAVTNYNVLTTLLGSLTGAVNTANGKQNDIATKLNSLLAELRTLGLIST